MKWRRRPHRQVEEQEVEVRSTAASPTSDAPFDNEFDAFLAGAYADWLLLTNRTVPSWAWLNKIAHGCRSELQEEVASSQIAGSDLDLLAWRYTVRFLAREVLAASRDDAALCDLQRRVLVPMELALAQEWWRSVAPIDLATLVLVAVQGTPRPT